MDACGVELYAYNTSGRCCDHLRFFLSGRVMQSAVKSFCLAIALRMIWGCVGFYNAIELAVCPNQWRFTISHLIRVKSVRRPKQWKPMVYEGLGSCFRSLVFGATAWVNFLKISVMMSTFPLPLLSFSSRVKSTASTSLGLDATTVFKGSLILGGFFALVQRSYCSQ